MGKFSFLLRLADDDEDEKGTDREREKTRKNEILRLILRDQRVNKMRKVVQSVVKFSS